MTSGIYSIANAVNGKLYYGSSVNVWQRKRQHWHALRTGKHRNPHLQRAWERYGEAAFTFRLVEEVTPEGLLALEQSYLDINKSGYNISRHAESSALGLKWSPESKRKMSAARKGTRLSEPHKRALSLAATGRRMTEAQRAATSERMKGISPSAAVKRKTSETVRALWQDVDYRKRTIAAQAKGKSAGKAAGRYSAAVAARWADPEQRGALSVERKTRWNDPEYRAKMLDKRRIQGQNLRERNQLKRETENAL